MACLLSTEVSLCPRSASLFCFVFLSPSYVMSLTFFNQFAWRSPWQGEETKVQMFSFDTCTAESIPELCH